MMTRVSMVEREELSEIFLSHTSNGKILQKLLSFIKSLTHY